MNGGASEPAPGSAAVNGRLWGARAAEWAELQEPTQARLYEAVLDRLAVAPGAAVLDVGCGAGGFAFQAAARRLRVSALDASENFIRVAGERVPDAEFVVGELEELPYADGSFDAVTGFNSFQFATRPVAALREARRVTRSDGRVVMLVWGDKNRCEMSAIMPVVGSFLPPPPAGASGPFALSAPGSVEGLLCEAGLEPIDAAEVPCPFAYPDRSTAVRALLSSGASARAIGVAGERPVAEALAEALAPFTSPDGSVRIENVFRYVVAAR